MIVKVVKTSWAQPISPTKLNHLCCTQSVKTATKTLSNFQELKEKVKSEYCGSLNFFIQWACRNGVDRDGQYVYDQIKDGKSNWEICEALDAC
jgi:hypothetical protein